ncbi:membrane fusion protein, multidrug efflux system [Halodesulfovibrio marinisediminis DSM 17456]|uniref:Membrane fusion protein, multidrug efflux system n=2 Tax=Halodesulfovibrio marinisediminis TaxID=458711 RepID=A0A1N6HDJ3_9BACT|nr:membrane fusion protein, multidrug efflux system [Halodesulfovibrio marinisediminis DSM 17456]
MLIVASMLVSLTACSNGEASETAQNVPESKEYVVNVKVEKLTPAAITDTIMLPGETEAIYDVSLAAEQDGLIEWVGVTEGDSVKADAQLVRIDLEALKAAKDRAEANLTMKKHQLKRRRKLYEGNVLSREELEQAETEFTVAETNLREAEVKYEHGIVVSPVAGMVNTVNVDPGEYVSKGNPIANIVNVDQIKITFNVPEMDVRFLSKGLTAPVVFDAYPREEWNGVVDFVAWKADPATRTFPVRLIVQNTDGRIRPGMIARASFVRRSLNDIVSIPLFSVIDKGGERIAFVEKNGVAEARTVKLGVIDGDRVQILAGLNVGENLIVAGHREVEDGVKVDVR